jgi:hypothetical protein
MPSNLTSITFPSSPALNQTFVYGTQTYQWNGTEWVVVYDSNAHPNAAVLTSGSQTIAGEKTFSNNLAINANLIVDTNTLYVNSSTNRVGVGTANPLQKFVVSNSGAEGLEIVPAISSNKTVIQTYNRSSDIYNTLDLRASDFSFTFSGGTEKLNINSSGDVYIKSTTASTTTTTGALKVDGGLGVAGNLNVGGDLGVAGNLNVGGIIKNTNPYFYSIPSSAAAVQNPSQNTRLYDTWSDTLRRGFTRSGNTWYIVPTTGLYLFTCTLMFDTSPSTYSYGYFSIIKRASDETTNISSSATYHTSSNSSNGYCSVTGSYLVECNANERIGIRYGGDPYGTAYDSFMGYLIG